MYMATGFYVTARLSIGILNIFCAVIFPKFRTFHLWNAVVAIIPTSFWIGSLWVAYPLNQVVQWISFIWGIHCNLPSNCRLVSVLFFISRDNDIWSNNGQREIYSRAVHVYDGILSRGRYGNADRKNGKLHHHGPGLYCRQSNLPKFCGHRV